MTKKICFHFFQFNMEDELFISEISRIKATTVWGAIKALDTFSQLTFIKNNEQVLNYFFIYFLKLNILTY